MVETRMAKPSRSTERTPLETLSRLKARDGAPFLSGAAYSAGEQLLSDFVRAQMQPRVTASLEPRIVSRGPGFHGNEARFSDTALDARRRVASAMKAVGPDLADVVLDFVCFEKGLEQMERERQWPVRSAKLMVRTALLALARHYMPSSARRPFRNWGAEGYRPDVSALFAED